MESSDYRPVSPLAIGALVVGCGSALAVVTWAAWALPIVGIGLSCAALAQLGRPDARAVGRPAALAGLALAAGFGAQALGAAAVGFWIGAHRARTTATAWIDAVREERFADALDIDVPPVKPPAGSDQWVPVDPETRARMFAERPEVRAVAGCGRQRRPTLLGTSRGEDGAGTWTVRASLAGCDGDDAVLRLVIEPRPGPRPTGSVDRWLVVSHDLER